MKQNIFHLLVLAVVALFVSCNTADNNPINEASTVGKYGIIHFGEEEIPVNSLRVINEDYLLVALSPSMDSSKMTTNAIIGLKRELLGSEVDVEYRYCNDDYIVVYEDPVCYYAPFRPLQSGTITMKIVGNTANINVDVVLYDGTPLRYSGQGLPL
jgi:hypothetical protein